MRGILCIFGKKKRLLIFTERLFELISSGISLQKALFILSRMNFTDIKLNRLASFLHKSILAGTKFSLAIKLAPYVSVADWYSAFITVSEEFGGISSVLEHLTLLLRHEKNTSRKIMDSLRYPCLLLASSAIAGYLSVTFILPSFSALFSENIRQIQENAVRTMIKADFFLLFVFSVFVLVTKKIFSQNQCAGIMKTLSFLRENSIPTLPAISCTLAFSSGNKRLSAALISVRKRLLDGEEISDCFGKCLEDSGFRQEGLLVAENLMFNQETGGKDAFAKAYSCLCEIQARREQVFLSSIQPFFLLVVAIYLCLISKAAFLPFITNLGGFL
jgi:type II secretory pathway component PulF